jgi:hypothetical protein
MKTNISQTALPGKLPFGDLPENKIVGANHLEVLNHKKTTEVLNKMFDKNNPGHRQEVDFFILN